MKVSIKFCIKHEGNYYLLILFLLQILKKKMRIKMFRGFRKNSYTDSLLNIYFVSIETYIFIDFTVFSLVFILKTVLEMTYS